MLNMYHWQREQALASEQMQQRSRHAYVMGKEEAAEQSHIGESLAQRMRALAFHLAPNTHWNREVAGKPAV